MKKNRHTTEQIIKKLRTVGEEQARGTSIEEVCRKLEISVATNHRWRKIMRSEDGDGQAAQGA